ncbi:MAG: cupin domain-containing protein [Planctomycetes bacterium]|nr:cupin domain-containing protein [Planctomycetota bacterium]
MKNLFSSIPTNLPEELTEILLEAESVRVERIVSHGHSSPDGFWYDQEQHEWVVVLKGKTRLTFEDKTVEMQPGDCINIPAHKRHRVDWTTPDEPTIWLAIHYGETRSDK